MNKYFTNSYSTDLLGLAFTSKEVMSTLNEFMDESFLESEEIKDIWKLMKREYSVVRNKPSISVVMQRMHDRNKKGKYDEALDLLDRIRNNLSEFDENALMSEFQSAIREFQFVSLYKEVSDIFNGGNREEAMQLLASKSKDIVNLRIGANTGTAIFGGFVERQVARETGLIKAISIPYNWLAIDQITNGGALTGELEMWLTSSGGGKSTALCSRAIQCAYSGHDVLHVQLEGTEDQVESKYDALWSRISSSVFRYRRFESPEIKSKIKKLKRSASKWLLMDRGEIIVETMGQFNSLTTEGLYRLVQTYVNQRPKLRVLVIDYAELLAKIGFDKKPEHERIIAIMRDLKNIAIEFNLLVVTAAQTSAINPVELNNSDFVISRYNCGKSRQMIEACTYVYTINSTQDERDNSCARVFVDKLREARSGQVIPIRQDLSISEFWLKVQSIQLQEAVLPEATVENEDSDRRASRQNQEVELGDGFEE